MPIGRTAELAEVRALLDSGAVVLVVGPAGIGKTTLVEALEPSRTVELDGVATPDALRTALARALESPVDTYEGVLAAVERTPLLLLDAADEAAPALAAVLPDLAARASVLLTARRRLDLPEALVFELGPLDEAHGAALLRERVRSARLRAAFDDADLAELARTLDCVPLALELAATLLRLYAPADLRSRVLEVLRTGAGSQLFGAVQQGVAAVSDPARHVLAVASALPGAFDVPLLAAAADLPVDQPLLELLDAALVHPLGTVPPTFRVLAPIRAVAAVPGDPRAVQGRAAPTILARAEAAAADLDGAAPAGSAPALQRLLPALEWLLDSSDPAIRLRAALALATHERRAGPQRATVERDLALPDEGPPALRVQWGLAVATAACNLHDPAHADRALARIEPALTDAERPYWQSMRAMWRTTRGELDLALDLARQACAAAEAASPTAPDPWLRFRLGAVFFAMGRPAEAAEAFAIARAVPGSFRRAQATYALCASLRDSGHPPDLVLAELDAVEAPADLAGFTWLAPRFLGVRAVLHADLGHIDAARLDFLGCADQLRQLGEPDDALGQWLNAHSMDVLEGRPPEAVLGPVPPHTERTRGPLDAWRAITHAMLGHGAAAAALAPVAVAELRARTDIRSAELTAALAVALAPHDPAQSAALASEVPEGPYRALTLAALAGEPVVAGPRFEQRWLAALSALLVTQARVRRDGGGFVPPGGEPVDISGRRVLKRILATLVASGEPLDVSAICTAVWPGEKLVGESGTRRVHVAISTLRGLGLREAIVTHTDDDGTTRWSLAADLVD
ncbi:MAG: hypothetical protein R3F61_21465 [Myxococcota bacterium]